MGGYGSGRWRDHQKALVVEDCAFLDATLLRKQWRQNGVRTSGTITWTRGEEQIGSASYSLQASGVSRTATLSLCYFGSQRGAVRESIGLTPTRPHYGGKRWWFNCPGCGGRTRKLLLPAGGSGFRCRRCYKLTYTSCQERKTTWETIRRLRRMGLLPIRGRKCPS